MSTRVVPYSEIESYSIERLTLDSANVITNTGLSPELIAELSGDMSTDVVLQLLKIQLSGVWRTFCNNPTDFQGVDEKGRPVYNTTWNGETWAYLPFTLQLDSMKTSGEIVSGSLSVLNYDKEIALAFENPTKAIPYKVYLVSKETGQLILSDEHKYIKTIHNSGAVISGDTSAVSVLSGQFPARKFSPIYFRR